MKILSILLIIFWTIIILAPEILAYLIWGFFIFTWLNMFFFFRNTEKFVKFGKYKIYR